jgi:hypothetical protein
LSREKLLNSPGTVAAIIGAVESKSEDESSQSIGRMAFSLQQQGTFYPFVCGFALDERKTAHKKEGLPLCRRPEWLFNITIAELVSLTTDDL